MKIKLFNIGGKTKALTKFKSWTNPYITDGLIAMWDGEWNAGGGVHSASPDVWSDLVGANDFVQTGQVSWGKNFVTIDNRSGKNGFTTLYDMSLGESPTYEVVATVDDGVTFATVPRFLSNARPAGSIYGDGVKLYIYVNSGFSFNQNSSRDNKYFAFAIDGVNNVIYGYSNGISRGTATTTSWRTDLAKISLINGTAANDKHLFTVRCIRCYDRVLTASEIAANYEIDRVRFNLP